MGFKRKRLSIKKRIEVKKDYMVVLEKQAAGIKKGFITLFRCSPNMEGVGVFWIAMTPAPMCLLTMH